MSTSNGYADLKDFSDVDHSNPYCDYILDLQSKNITQGIGEDRFAPDDPITRAQFVTLMARAYHLPVNDHPVHFSDVRGHWAGPSIESAWGVGMVHGTTLDTFDPDSPIRREDAAAMVWNYLQSLGVKPSVQNFMLPKTVDAWARAGVAQCEAKKLFGVPFLQGSFQDPMSRKEAAALIDLSLKQAPQL